MVIDCVVDSNVLVLRCCCAILLCDTAELILPPLSWGPPQPAAMSAPSVPQPLPPAARVAGEAIDLTDDTAAPAAPQSPAPSQGGSAAGAQASRRTK